MIEQDFSEGTSDTLHFKPRDEQEQNTPYSIEIEQELLGALLRDNEHFDAIGDFLQTEHFYYPLHRHIYEKIAYTILTVKNIASPNTIRYLLENEPIFKENDGVRYLNDLVFGVSTSMNSLSHAKIIFDLARRRLLLKHLAEYHLDILNKPTTSIDDFIADIEKSLYDLSTSYNLDSQTESFDTITIRTIKQVEEARKRGIMGLSTGYLDLDSKIGGFNRSDLLILAGRPGMGKTAFACNIALRVARKLETGSVLFFSHEMSADQVILRVLGIHAEVNTSDIRSGKMAAANFNKLLSVQKTLEGLPLYVDDTVNMNVGQMLQRARRHQKEYGLSLIIVDYLQLMQVSRRNDNRAVEMSEVSRGLKAIAKELDVPVIALSQLNRKAEERDDPRPNLADLRDSGSIEQDADLVLFIYREYYYSKNKEPKQRKGETDGTFSERAKKHVNEMEKMKDQATIFISKNRHGATGQITLSYHDEHGRFDNFTSRTPVDPFS